MTRARPFIFVNMAMTADGKITSASREHPEFTSRADRLNMDRLRAQADAILIGAGTLRADDPPLHVRDADAAAARRASGKPEHLWHVIVSATLALDPSRRFFTDPRTRGRIIATTRHASAEKRATLAPFADLWDVDGEGGGRVDMRRLVERLAAERGVERLLVEGGAETNWAFFAAGLVDELYVTVCPSLLGGRDAPTPVGGVGFAMHERVLLDLVEARPVDGELFCRYRVRTRAACRDD